MHHATDALIPLAPTQISFVSAGRQRRPAPAMPSILAQSLAWFAGATAFAAAVMLATGLLAVLD